MNEDQTVMSSPDRPNPSRQAQLALTVGALGVVFGDIGTSPLYALRECLLWLGPVDRTEGVLGALSLIFWALCFEVGVKYLGFVTRADNRGEGGIFALVGLSIGATSIASQALISGTFSLTRQAIQLGFFPRLKIIHTNPEQMGQIYLPLVNIVLAFTTIWVVLGFGSSDRLAAAYGVAVTGTMVVTSVAFFEVTRLRWGWSRLRAGLVCGTFILVETVFLVANLHKFADGGWLPLALALGLLAVMHTWKSGRTEIQEKVYSGGFTELELAEIVKSKSIVRVPGSAVFMAASPRGVPLALLHHLKSNKCLHQTVVLLTISFEEIPQVPPEERLILTNERAGVWRAIGYYGYMESPDVGALCEELKARGVPLKPQEVTFYFNREMIVSGGNARMWEWQKSLYAFLSRNARPVKDYYKVLPTQVIEIGLPVQL